MSEPMVLRRVDGGIAHLVLNRPQRHNALIPGLLRDLRDALADCARQPAAALVLTANGPSFSTGGDVAAFHDCPTGQSRRRYAEEVVGLLNGVIEDLLRLPFPSIAGVHGMVTGGSIGLVLGCDLVVAGPRASFTPWYVDVGFSPDGGWTALLPARIGSARALSAQLLNRTIGAREAFDWGLVTHLAEQGRESAVAAELAARIADKKIGSIRRTLALMRPNVEAIAVALEAERRQFVEQIQTQEAEAGMAAFLGRG